MGGDVARTADQNGPKAYSKPYYIFSVVRAERTEEKGGAFVIYATCITEQPLYIMKLHFREVARHCLLMENRE